MARGSISAEPDEKLAWLLVIGTIPVALLGVFLQEPVRRFFGSSAIVASFLIVNAFVMFAGEALRRRALAPGATGTRPRRALVGRRRQGRLLTGRAHSCRASRARARRSSPASCLGLAHDDAARYSFLLATPVIFAASVLEIPKLLAPEAHAVLLQSAAGCVLAGLTAYASVAFLTRWFHTHDLRPFGWYCLIFGTLCLALALAKVIT